ncbi:major facilitator superfamily domain-containing protein [Xylariaceae sp. FL0016]|nr:major facilitator superfamily domain-containing protein [Xylariaceae sp. FL0016]
MYFFNFVDRGALAQARLDNFEDNLGMKDDDFNVAVSILTVGYILMQVPSNMLLTRLRPSIYLSVVMFIWSTISACTGLVGTYGDLIACRFLLGFFEAPFYPGALYLLAIFYTRKEVATRIAIQFTAQMAGLSFANLIAAGIFHGLDGKRELAGWRWLFIIEGTASAVTAIAACWLLPNSPERTQWLHDEDQEVMRARTRREQLVEAQEHEVLWSALKCILKDKRLWLFCAMKNFHYVGLSLYQRCCPLRGLLYFPGRRILRQLGHSRMGCHDVVAKSREESGSPRSDQRICSDCPDLWRVSLAEQ